MIRLKTLGTILTLLIVSSVAIAQPAQKPAAGERRSKEGWFICETGNPSVELTWPNISSKDQCTGSAKIQGIMWRCGSIDEVVSNTRTFYKRLTQSAKKRCEAHCKDRAKNCTGSFRPPDKCRFSIKTDMAKHMGKRVGCHKGCDGKALSYCSLYHSSLLSINKGLLAKERPNCYCRPGKNSVFDFF